MSSWRASGTMGSAHPSDLPTELFNGSRWIMTVIPDQTSYMQPASHSTASDADYTAVVYFQRIGSQRHYEEVSSLLQQFDQLIYKHHFPGNPRSLQTCMVEVEQGRVGRESVNKAVPTNKV